MRVGSNSLTESAYQLYQRNQSSPQPTSFDDLLRAAASNTPKMTASGHFEGKAVDPHFEILFQYTQWKKQQPERVLPDSQGATEENLAYLLENFSGELSPFQCIDVVDTMYEMGILTKEQMYAALGLDFTLVAVDPNCTIIAGPLESGRSMELWRSSFSEHPLANAQYLDDLLEILDRILRGDSAEDIANDLQEAFDKVKQKVQEVCILNS